MVYPAVILMRIAEQDRCWMSQTKTLDILPEP